MSSTSLRIAELGKELLSADADRYLPLLMSVARDLLDARDTIAADAGAHRALVKPEEARPATRALPEGRPAGR